MGIGTPNPPENGSMKNRYDVHTHAFHPKIAAKVIHQLEDYYHVPSVGTGEFKDLARRLERAGLTRCCVHSAATSPEQVVPANRWAISLKKKNPAFIPFGTMHPGFAKMEDELAVLWNAGIRGIKLHADFQGFWLDDPALEPLFAAMEGRFTLMAHVGDARPPKDNPSCPYKVAAIKRKFSRLQIIAAHFGGVHHWKWVIDALQGLDIYLDTSSTLWAIDQETLEALWNAFPRNHFLFGSDYPLFDPADEMENLRQRLCLSEAQMEELLTNAEALQLIP